MHVVVINASPRVRKYSNTDKIMISFCRGLIRRGASFEKHAISERKYWGVIRQAFLDNDEIVFAVPLYAEAVPGLMLEFLETLPKKDNRTRVSFILQGGFAEGCRLRCGEELLRDLTKYLGVSYGGCLVKGDNFSIRLREGECLDRIIKPYEKMGELFANGDGFRFNQAKKFTGPEIYSTPVRIATDVVFKTVAKRTMIKMAEAAFGCTTPLDYKPWAQNSYELDSAISQNEQFFTLKKKYNM